MPISAAGAFHSVLEHTGAVSGITGIGHGKPGAFPQTHTGGLRRCPLSKRCERTRANDCGCGDRELALLFALPIGIDACLRAGKCTPWLPYLDRSFLQSNAVLEFEDDYSLV